VPGQGLIDCALLDTKRGHVYMLVHMSRWLVVQLLRNIQHLYCFCHRCTTWSAAACFERSLGAASWAPKRDRIFRDHDGQVSIDLIPVVLRRPT
jgi:hypothetical protein